MAETNTTTAPETPPAVTPANDNVTVPEPVSPPKLEISFDEQVKADLAFKKQTKAAHVELENKRKEQDARDATLAAREARLNELNPVFEAIDKGEIEEAIWTMTKGRVSPENVLKLADRVAEAQASGEEAAAVPMKDQIKAALEEERKAREAAAKEADEQKTTAEKADWDRDFNAYVAAAVAGTPDHPGFLKSNQAEFPLCVAWRNRLVLPDIEAEVKRRLNNNESVDARDVFKVFEDRFQAEIDATPYGKKASQAPERGFEDEEREYFEARKPKILIQAKPADDSPYTVSSREWQPPQGKDFDEAVAEYFAKLDRDRKNRARF